MMCTSGNQNLATASVALEVFMLFANRIRRRQGIGLHRLAGM